MKNRIEITGGKFKKLSLRAPAKIRPTTSIVKRSLFDTLGYSIEEAVVLDVFAGSGAIGFEALSRGANRVVFIDKSRDSIKSILENTRKLGLEPSTFEIIKADFKKGMNLLINRSEKFDFIFADPPYGFERLDDLFKMVPMLLKDLGIFVLEEKKTYTSKYLEKVKEVCFGQTCITYYCSLSREF